MILIFQKIISLKNTLRHLYQKSPKKFIMGVVFIALSAGAIYFGLWEGLNFIISLGGLGTIIIKKIIFIFYFMLFFMIAVSFGILFYGISFRGRETEFLFRLPIDEGKIVFYKFIETFVFASWISLLGFFFFFLAYAQVGRINVVLPLMCPFFTLPFLIISCFFGYVITLFVARFIDLKKFFIGMLVFLALFFYIYTRYSKPPEQGGVFYFISEDIAFFRLSKLWFAPFSWPAYGLTYFEDGNLKQSFIYFANLWSLAGLFFICVPSFKNVFVKIYQLHLSFAHRKIISKDYISLIVSGLKFLPRYMRTFIIKDIKLFLREPGLWLQFLVFYGILFFYFLNLRRFSYQYVEDVWKNALTFLNIFSILCIVSGMGIRFVFPQWSLEGRNFWIIKLTPVALKKVFWEKFIFSSLVLFVISELLIFTSNHMLKLKDIFFNLTLTVVSVASLTLISISLGLGAYFADFKEEYYLKAVESMGGFVALVINFIYTFSTIFLFGTITHLYFIGKLTNLEGILRTALVSWIIFSLIIAVFVSWLGLRKLENKEY